MRFFNWLNHTNMLDGCSRYLINPELGCLRYLSREELPLAWRAGSSRTPRESLAALLQPHKRACSRARMKVKSRGSGWSLLTTDKRLNFSKLATDTSSSFVFGACTYASFIHVCESISIFLSGSLFPFHSFFYSQLVANFIIFLSYGILAGVVGEHRSLAHNPEQATFM